MNLHNWLHRTTFDLGRRRPLAELAPTAGLARMETVIFFGLIARLATKSDLNNSAYHIQNSLQRTPFSAMSIY